VIMFVGKSEWLVSEVMINVWCLLTLQLLSCSGSEGLITFSEQLCMDSLFWCHGAMQETGTSPCDKDFGFCRTKNSFQIQDSLEFTRYSAE
jgi:hypothetical protein